MDNLSYRDLMIIEAVLQKSAVDLGQFYPFAAEVRDLKGRVWAEMKRRLEHKIEE